MVNGLCDVSQTKIQGCGRLERMNCVPVSMIHGSYALFCVYTNEHDESFCSSGRSNYIAAWQEGISLLLSK